MQQWVKNIEIVGNVPPTTPGFGRAVAASVVTQLDEDSRACRQLGTVGCGGSYAAGKRATRQAPSPHLQMSESSGRESSHHPALNSDGQGSVASSRGGGGGVGQKPSRFSQE